MVFKLGCVDVYAIFLSHALLVGSKEIECVLVDVIYPLEPGTLIYRPRKWAHLYLQLLFQFVKEFEWVASFTIHLVDEDYYRGITHTAHFHQFACLSLYTLRTIYHDDSRIHGGEGAICVFGEVLVTRCVKDVYLIGCVPFGCRWWEIVKLHNRC